MDTTGDFGLPPPQTPPPGRPPVPPVPPVPPPKPPIEAPPLFPPVHRPRAVLKISVSRRMLWISSAAIPLHNIAWVEASRLRPDRGKILLHLLMWLVAAVVVWGALDNTSNDWADAGEGETPPILVVVAAPVLFQLIRLFQWAKPILIVGTAGGSTAVVTLPSIDELRAIAGQIVHAIEHPEAEFTAYVNQLHTYNGPVFNQTGAKNTGIKL